MIPAGFRGRARRMTDLDVAREAQLMGVDEDALRGAISATGYQVLSIQSAPYEKKGLFSFRK